jgi:hypothetical protein
MKSSLDICCEQPQVHGWFVQWRAASLLDLVCEFDRSSYGSMPERKPCKMVSC